MNGVRVGEKNTGDLQSMGRLMASEAKCCNGASEATIVGCWENEVELLATGPAFIVSLHS